MITKNRLFQIVKIVVCLILIIIIGINVYLLNIKKKTTEIMVMPFGVGMAVVLSGSMEPELSINDLIIVKSDDSYEIGDVVVYQDNGRLVVHRIISFDENGVVTKGDANNTEDAPINKNDIKGKVWFHINGFGKVVNYMKTPQGICIVLCFTLFLFFITKNKSNQEGLVKEEIEVL